MITRVVQSGIATQSEIEQSWSYEDLLYWNKKLDEKLYMEILAQQAQQREANQK
jgi:hypothetical protein